MFGFVLRRVALIVPTFIGVTLLAFALIHLIPGDPVENLSGERGHGSRRAASGCCTNSGSTARCRSSTLTTSARCCAATSARR